jgi:hypothetical protein
MAEERVQRKLTTILAADVEGSRSASQSMIRLALGFEPARMVYAAAKIGIANEIAASGSNAQDLARSLGVDEGAMYRLLRALAGLGVVLQSAEDRFTLTSLGETLRTEGTGSVRDYVIWAHEVLYDGFRGLVDSVRTGEPEIGRVLGLPLFEYLEANPDKGSLYRAGLGNLSRIESAAILTAYDFSATERLVDVGGGNGAFLGAIVAANPHISGVLFDRPAEIDAARVNADEALEGCEFVAGDFFKTVPPGGDVYLVKRILLDWSDEDVVRILSNCRAAMAGFARLLIIEALIGPANEASPAHLFDMVKLITTKGVVRSEDENARLLDQAGFRLERTIPTDSDVTILEAVVD